MLAHAANTSLHSPTDPLNHFLLLSPPRSDILLLRFAESQTLTCDSNYQIANAICNCNEQARKSNPNRAPTFCAQAAWVEGRDVILPFSTSNRVCSIVAKLYLYLPVTVSSSTGSTRSPVPQLSRHKLTQVDTSAIRIAQQLYVTLRPFATPEVHSVAMHSCDMRRFVHRSSRDPSVRSSDLPVHPSS